MKIIPGLCALLIATAPVAAFAGEGNGPSFPGYQAPDVGITTTFGAGGEHSSVTSEIDHSASALYEPSASFPDDPSTFPETQSHYATRDFGSRNG